MGLVLNVSNDHLGLKGVNTVEELADVKRIVVEVARDCAVLNGDDVHCLKMALCLRQNVSHIHHEPAQGWSSIQIGGLAAVLENQRSHDHPLHDKSHIHCSGLT